MEKENLELLDLYDQYMDQEMIDEINEQDDMEEEMEQRRRGQKTEAKFPEEVAISISDFVNNYLGLKADCSHLWHQGLKDLGSSFVFGVDNTFANKNPDLVYKGELLLVVDARGNRGTYINPNFLKELLEKEEVERELSILRRTGVRDLKKLSSYLDECVRLQNKIETNRKFENTLYDAHKLRKFKELKKELKHDQF